LITKTNQPSNTLLIKILRTVKLVRAIYLTGLFILSSCSTTIEANILVQETTYHSKEPTQVVRDKEKKTPNPTLNKPEYEVEKTLDKGEKDTRYHQQEETGTLVQTPVLETAQNQAEDTRQIPQPPEGLPEYVTNEWLRLYHEFGYDPQTTAALVSVSEQKLWIVSQNYVHEEITISTGKGGLSNVPDSEGTPLGVHEISWVVRGDRCEILRGSGRTGRYGCSASTAYMTTRALALNGLELQNNKSMYRGIFIHGTNKESSLGIPVSGGCIRVANDDSIVLAHILPTKSLVSILA